MKKTGWAAAAMAGMILLSCVLGGWRSMASLRTEAEQVFVSGVDGDGLGIENDLNDRIDDSYNLTVIARRYLNETDPAIRQLLEARTALIDAKDPSAKYKANQRLTETLEALSQKLKSSTLSLEDESARARLMTNLESRNATMSHDGYNAGAEEFNRKLSGTPGGLFAGLLGVRPLELFR